MIDLYNSILTINEIQQFLDTHAEESINLAFKPSKELAELTPKVLNKLSVILSAFANMTGGILIYGIETKRRMAHCFSFINSSNISAGNLLFQVQSRISRKIKGLKIDVINIENNPLKSVLIFRIPESKDAPHMAFDKKYYRRYNYKEAVMDEHEIRMLYGKSNITEIEFFGIINTNGVPVLSNGKFEHINFYPRFLVRNISSAIELYYKIELAVPIELHDSSFAAMQNYFTRHEGIYGIFSIPNRTPLFQEELATIFEAKLHVNSQNYHVFENEYIKLKLFYSNGTKLHEFRLKDTFKYKNMEIMNNNFVTTQPLCSP
ncbi:MAG: ATP-binding protein [Bacteroidia bacterium]|nr:ATP-binding protein [Bacteroidia bacterium]